MSSATWRGNDEHAIAALVFVLSTGSALADPFPNPAVGADMSGSVIHSYTANGTPISNPKQVMDSCTFAPLATTCPVILSGPAVFSDTTYRCRIQQDNGLAGVLFSITYTSVSQFTINAFTGLTGGFTVNYGCAGK